MQKNYIKIRKQNILWARKVKILSVNIYNIFDASKMQKTTLLLFLTAASIGNTSDELLVQGIWENFYNQN